jgi:uncharacterized protein (TIGR02680 family)
MTVTELHPPHDTTPRHSEEAAAEGLSRRWRPTRAGIVNIWRYYDETFHFHKGRLLLRGPNGTGKSKALELLLPYLLDANLRPSRLSTFGGTERTMYWNLMGDGYPGATRVGYVWLEFGRAGDDGRAEWFTCGARLQAGRSSRQVLPPTYFTSRRRIGAGLDLLADDGRPLTRAELAAALDGDGAVFDSAAGDYRRMVRHVLFPEFNEEQYEALIAALLQLRRPKLSEHLDPEELSALLSEALPPLDSGDVAEIAEGFERLDRRREDLLRLEREVAAAESLARRARSHAQRVLRAAAAAVISATSAMDGATRKARESKEAYEAAGRQLRAVEEAQGALDLERHRVEQRIEGLIDSDAYRKGKSLDDLCRAAEEAKRQAERTRAEAAERGAEADDDATRAAEAIRLAGMAAEQAGRAREEAARAAGRAGLAAPFQEVAATEEVMAARRLLGAAVEARSRQVGEVRRALAAHRGAIKERTRAERHLEECREQRARSETELSELEARRGAALGRLREALAQWAVGCVELPLAETADELAAAAEEEAAVLRIVGEAAARLVEEVSRAETTLAADRAGLVAERDAHVAERAELERTKVLVPEPPDTRTADRAALPGAPLWRVVDWRPGVDEATQAGIEAALEASGLLDAWVLPSGELHVPGHDTLVEAGLATPVPRGASPAGAATASLADVLAVEPDAPVPSGRVDSLLAGIAFVARAAERAGHPAAVAADGSWRLGPARGSWSKPTAGFIGATAQQRARRRRIRELTELIDGLEARIREVDERLGQLAARRDRAAGEQRRRPPHAELGGLTERVERAAATVAARHDQETRADQERAGADMRVAATLRDLSLLASGHGLPTTEEALDQVTEALTTCRASGDAWLDLTERARSAAQRAGDAETQARRSRTLADRSREQAAELHREAQGKQARYQQVDQTIGAEYREVVARMAALRDRLGEIDARLKELQRERLRLTGRVGELKAETRRAEEDGARAVGERDAAVERFRRLQAAGFTGEARLSARLPEPTGARATLEAARAVASELATVTYEQRNIKDAEAGLSQAMYSTQEVLGGRADLALEPEGEVVVLVATVDGARVGAVRLHALLRDELAEARGRLTEYEQDLFDRTLTGDTRRQVASRIRLAEELKGAMNAQLRRVRTVSGLSVRLDWRIDPELPPAMREARDLLLRDPAGLSEADRQALHAFFRARIDEVRAADTAVGWEQQLLQVLDYRRWHQFVVLMDKGDGAGPVTLTKRKHGALSGGEKAIALHLPLFAAAAAHYRAAPHAPRLILLDEVFVGVDDANRGQLLDLLVKFDLDMVLTSDHEWCTYRELDGIAIHQLITGDDDEAVTTVRFVWDGTGLREADRSAEAVPRQELLADD